MSAAASMGPVIALVGNPNVGKSTVFNALTGLRQSNTAASNACRRTSRPSPPRAEVPTTRQPSSSSKTAKSTWMSFFAASSRRFTHTTTGHDTSSVCSANAKFRSKQVASVLMGRASEIADKAVSKDSEAAQRRDRALDRLLTSGRTGIPVMLLLLALVLWLTMVGANVPSALLSKLLLGFQEPLREPGRFQ